MVVFITQENWIDWVNLVLNVVEGIVLFLVLIVLLRWAKHMVEFMELMDEVKVEEKFLKSRTQEWPEEDE